MQHGRQRSRNDTDEECEMETRQLGKTDLWVSRLGAGLAEIGFELTLDNVAEAGRAILNTC